MIPTSKPAAGRPTELVAFFAIAGPVYGWLVSAQVDAPHLLAVVLAVVCGLVPLVVSTLKDAALPADDPGDHVIEALPAQLAPAAIDQGHEQHGIDHSAERAGAG